MKGCLELLDQHLDARAVPYILRSLKDPVPRVRWHAVHALLCDACKAGGSFLTADVAAQLEWVGEHDPSPKVRKYARQALAGRRAA